MKINPETVLIMPVYEDRESSSRLFRELREVLGTTIFLVVVDDGSVRQPVSPTALEVADLEGVVIRLKRNLGHQMAIATGISFVATNFPSATCIVMDSDGEDAPETIPILLDSIGKDDVDVVVAQRKSRMETIKFKVFYVIYRLLFQLLTGQAINFGNFMALKPAAVKRLSGMQELGVHVAGCVLVSKLRVQACPIDRGSRYAGRSKMNFAGLVLHGFKAFMLYAEFVLVRVGVACAFIAVVLALAILASLALKAFGHATPGWASVALALLVLMLFQTGILVLTILMLTGIVRGLSARPSDYLAFIDEVHWSNQHEAARQGGGGAIVNVR